MTDNSSSLKVFEYDGSAISFNLERDIMINATQMAKPFGKETSQFLINQQTKDFIKVLEGRLGNPSLEIRRGGTSPGTWMHQKLALKFAAWLSPEFELWCFDRIEELLLDGATCVRPKTPTEALLESVQRMVDQERRLDHVESDILELKAATTVIPNFSTVAGYATFTRQMVNLQQAAIIGKKASKICRERGIEFGKVKHPWLGLVNTYPDEILKEVFKGLGK